MRVGVVKQFWCNDCSIDYKKFVKTEDGDMVHLCQICGNAMKEWGAKRPYWQPFTPHYNKQLDQTFHTADEERSYTKRNGLVEIRSEMQAAKAGRKQWRYQR